MNTIPKIRYLKRLLPDILYPPRCVCCGDIIAIQKRVPYYEGTPDESCFLHKKCRQEFTEIRDHFCRVCGTPLPPSKQLCPRCEEGKRAFNEGRSLLVYEGKAREAMLQIKYHSGLEYCDYFACLAFMRLGRWISEKKISVIVPVPIHKKKLHSRGYNQAFELARRIGSYTGIPVRNDLLVRTKNTTAQKQLSPEQRSMNLIDAFDARESLPPETSVLLVDDIYTTGATMDTCSWVLRMKAGAGAVYALSILAASMNS